MRRVLVDHAKAGLRVKRGGRPARISLDEALQVTPEPSADLVALDMALDKLAGFDSRKSRAVELHYFGGMSYDETALALEVSRATVKRDLKLAKAWLHQELTAGPAHAP